MAIPFSLATALQRGMQVDIRTCILSVLDSGGTELSWYRVPLSNSFSSKSHWYVETNVWRMGLSRTPVLYQHVPPTLEVEVKFVSTHTKGTRIELCSLMIGKVMITQSVVLKSSGHTVEMFMNVWWEGQVWPNSGSDNQRIICLNVSTQFNYTGGLIHGLIFPECTWEEWAPLGVQLLFPAWHMAIAVIVECSSSW